MENAILHKERIDSLFKKIKLENDIRAWFFIEKDIYTQYKFLFKIMYRESKKIYFGQAYDVTVTVLYDKSNDLKYISVHYWHLDLDVIPSIVSCMESFSTIDAFHNFINNLEKEGSFEYHAFSVFTPNFQEIKNSFLPRYGKESWV